MLFKIFYTRINFPKPFTVLLLLFCVPNLFGQGADTLITKDTTKISKEKKYSPKKYFPSGNISLEYDYGMIPFTTLDKVPDQLFRTEGTMEANLFKLPFNACFSYTNSKNVFGLNNYFRVSFDSEKYKEQLRGKAAEKQEEYKNKLKNLYSSRQTMEQKLAYYKHIQKFPQPKIPNLPKDSLQILDSMNTSGFILPGDSLDTLKNKIPTTPQIPNTNQYSDSLKNLANSQEYQDSIQGMINEYEGKVKEINAQIDETKKLKDKAENPVSSLEQEYLYKNKFYRFFKSVKKFDIGLCYPTHSTFLVNGIALRGINFEWQNDYYYLAVTHGKTVNNIFYSNNVIQNNLNAVKNLYNFFDFNNVEAGRRITAVKFGVGQKDQTHFYLGVLNGLGYTSYYQDSLYDYSPSLQKNFVIELDGKWVINKSNSIDLVYGKSLIKNEDAGPSANGFDALFSSSNRSNALFGRYNTAFAKTGTRLTFTTRWIDPYFKSFGVGFIRPDNLRYEIKAEQRLTKKVKLTGFYRYEEDNLLSLLTNTTSLQSAGANVTWKVTKRLTIRGGYTPVFLQIKSGETVIQKNDNYIGNAVVTYAPKAKKFRSIITGMYSYYLLFDGVQNNEFQNSSLLYTIETERGIKNDITGNWFQSSVSDSLPGETYLITDELTVSIKKLKVTGGGKYAVSDMYGNQFGYSLKAAMPLNKVMTLEAGAEKVVVGEFFSSINLEMLNKFPYFCFARLIIHW